MGVAVSAVAALGDDDPLPRFGNIGEQGFLVFVEDLGAGGNLDGDGFAFRPGTVFAHAVPAAPGLEVLFVAKIYQRIALDRKSVG